MILLFALLKVIEEGSHMVMMECPDTVNTLLHEFFLWEPDQTSKNQSNKNQSSKPQTTTSMTTEKTLTLSSTYQTLRISKSGDK
uniref:Uncharacterized protein n=1 Tax=Knipowitschia caucasica TaxID=637954 RepID=A0AAV2L5E2_KNICA